MSTIGATKLFLRNNLVDETNCTAVDLEDPTPRQIAKASGDQQLLQEM